MSYTTSFIMDNLSPCKHIHSKHENDNEYASLEDYISEKDYTRKGGEQMNEN